MLFTWVVLWVALSLACSRRCRRRLLVLDLELALVGGLCWLAVAR